MKVKAIEMGYYGHVRIRPETVFEMDDATCAAAKDAEGQSRLPKWVVPADYVVKQKGMHLPGAKVVKQPKHAGKAVIPPMTDPKDQGKLEVDGGKKSGASTGDSDVI